MNITVLSLVLAAAQPLLQAILSCNINEISVGNLKKAKFKLVHSLKGRRRYSSVLLKDVTFAFTLKEKLQKLDLFSSIEVNSFTGTVLLIPCHVIAVRFFSIKRHIFSSPLFLH